MLTKDESLETISLHVTVVPVKSPSKVATMVAVDESVTAVAVATEFESTALNLSSPSFQ